MSANKVVPIDTSRIYSIPFAISAVVAGAGWYHIANVYYMFRSVRLCQLVPHRIIETAQPFPVVAVFGYSRHGKRIAG